MERIDPLFKKHIEKFGAAHHADSKSNWQECYHCGQCTAICPLSEDKHQFPRKAIRNLQMGLKEKVDRNIDPWMCYYCGECSDTCPRDANPGELMMIMRRYLTSVYDWTGISKVFYTKKHWELFAILSLSLIIILLFAFFLPISGLAFSSPESFVNNQGGVMINSLVEGVSGRQFVTIIEFGDISMALLVGFLLISNIVNMWRKVIYNNPDRRVPFFAYFKEAYKLIIHFIAQPKFYKCDDKKYWGGHFLMMSGYTIMFILIVALLPEFQVEAINPWYHWQRLLGYYATIGILVFLVSVTIKRLKKQEAKQKFSHLSDWLFIVLLFLTTVSGILIHIFRITGLPVATYFTYIIHLAVLVPMIMVEVPFSKWSHLAYRPFAVYFSALLKSSVEKKENVPSFATI
jgi:ferredoxin